MNHSIANLVLNALYMKNVRSVNDIAFNVSSQELLDIGIDAIPVIEEALQSLEAVGDADKPLGLQSLLVCYIKLVLQNKEAWDRAIGFFRSADTFLQMEVSIALRFIFGVCRIAVTPKLKLLLEDWAESSNSLVANNSRYVLENHVVSQD
jgi:hypothetical protein